MTNDQRLDGFHNYRFEMYCADQAEITSLRTQLAEVTDELAETKRLRQEFDTQVQQAGIRDGNLITSLRAQLAEVTEQRNNWADTVHGIAVKGLGLTDPLDQSSTELPADWLPATGLLSDRVLAMRNALAEVARERDQWAKKWNTSLDTYGENLIARGDEIDSLRHDRDVLMGQLGNTKIKLEAATEERDRLRAALIDCAVPLEVLHAIDCELAPATQAGITAAIAAIRSALFSAQPEPKPLTPADRVMIALAGRDKDDAERTLDKMYPKPEPKPEAPKPHVITRDDLTKAGPG